MWWCWGGVGGVIVVAVLLYLSKLSEVLSQFCFSLHDYPQRFGGVGFLTIMCGYHGISIISEHLPQQSTSTRPILHNYSRAFTNQPRARAGLHHSTGPQEGI